MRPTFTLRDRTLTGHTFDLDRLVHLEGCEVVVLSRKDYDWLVRGPYINITETPAPELTAEDIAYMATYKAPK